jgi:hypothetical protein
MKISRILPVAGILTLLACGAAFTQVPTTPGAGVGVHWPPPGSRWHHLTKMHSHHRSETSRHKRVNPGAVH